MTWVSEPTENRPDPAAVEAPEADRLEQQTPVEEDAVPSPPTSTPYEADEGDALEQSIEVPVDDDY